MRQLVFISASLFVIACDAGDGVNPEPRAPVSQQPVTQPDEPDTSEGYSHLVSRFGPSRGIVGQPISIITMFDARGCVAAGTCQVSIGDVSVPIDDDAWILTVTVPLGAQTGPVCVTYEDQTECGETFTVMPAPLIHSIWPEQVAAGARDFVLQVYGEGFIEGSQVRFGGELLATTFDGHGNLSAVVPSSLIGEVGTRAITVFAPGGRCGLTSEAFDFFVE